MKRLLAFAVLSLLASGCTRTVYDGSEKAYGMHPEWTDKQPNYMPGDANGNPPEN